MNSKKMTAGLLAVMTAFGCLAAPVSVFADDPGLAASETQSLEKIVYGDKFVYRIEAGVATILDLNEAAISSKGTVKIPETLDGCTVEAIDSGVSEFFRSHWKTIKLVVFPRTLTAVTREDHDEQDLGIGYTDEWKISEYDAYTHGYYTRNPNVKIKCGKDTEIEQYARNHDVRYSYVDGSDTDLAQPVINKTIKITGSSIKFKWFPVEGADGYIVSRFVENYDNIKQIAKLKGEKNTALTDKGLKVKNDYSYVIKAYKKIGGATFYSPDVYYIFNCKAAKPKVKSFKGCGIAVKKDKNNGRRYTMIEVYDYKQKKWCPVVKRKVNKKSGYKYFYPQSYAVFDENGTRADIVDINKKSKYKFRVRIFGTEYSEYSKTVSYDPKRK